MYQTYNKMDAKKRVIHLNIRRYDLSDNPEILKKTVELSDFIDYNTMKTDLRKICGLNGDQVVKIRNDDGVLIPISFLMESDEKSFFIDVANVSYTGSETKLLQDAYVDAVQQKIKTLESRISQSECILPQLEWRRQAYMEETISGLMNKVLFLNRRFDELLPLQKSKLTQSTS